METPPQSLEEAFEELDFKFLLNLPESEIQAPERLFFQIEQAHWFYEDFLADNHSHLRHFHKFDEFAMEMFKRCETLQHLLPKFDDMYEQFKRYRTMIPIFGAILLNDSLDKVLLVQGYRSKTWSFPKGKVNENEEEIVCAAREVYEEIGFDCSKLINPKHYVESVSKQGKRIKLFIVRGAPEDFQYGPRVRKEISDVKFFDVSELPTSNENSSKKFWALQNFTPRLLRWIEKQRRSNSRANSRPASRSNSRPHSRPNSRPKEAPADILQSVVAQTSKKGSKSGSNKKSSKPETHHEQQQKLLFKLDMNELFRAMSPYLAEASG